MRAFPASWWTTAVLGLFYFHWQGEIYHTIRQGDFGDFCRHKRATLISSYIVAQDWMTPVLGQHARSPHHSGQPLCLVCSDSSGEGRYTIQFAMAILVILAATTCATPISPYTAAQGWMTPLLGQRAPSSHHGG
jgi:hypothetical protein